MHFPETVLPTQQPSTGALAICHDPVEYKPAWQLIGILTGQERTIVSDAARLDRAMHGSYAAVLDLIDAERARDVVGCLRQLARVCKQAGNEGPASFRRVVADDKTRRALFRAATQQLQEEGDALPVFDERFLKSVEWISAQWTVLNPVLRQTMPISRRSWATE